MLCACFSAELFRSAAQRRAERRHHHACLCAERLDGAIETAARLSVSTKYAKKVRRRLLSSLDEPQPGEADPQTSEAAAAIDPPAPSTPPAAAGGASGMPFGPATTDARRSDQQNLQRSISRAAVPRDALLPVEVPPRAGDAAPAVNNHGALLAALLPRAKPKPAPVSEGRTNGHALAHVATNGVRREPSSIPTVRALSGRRVHVFAGRLQGVYHAPLPPVCRNPHVCMSRRVWRAAWGAVHWHRQPSPTRNSLASTGAQLVSTCRMARSCLPAMELPLCHRYLLLTGAQL